MSHPDDFTNHARGPEPRARLLLAHGAGAPADSPYMETLAAALAAHGTEVVRFEFPYMAKNRAQGVKRPPPRADTLVAHFHDRLRALSSRDARPPVFIGGKSMGGRVATLLAASGECPQGLAGVICFGYPFHPSGKAGRWRIAHLPHVHCPTCIIQGSRDPFGRPDEVAAYPAIARAVDLNWIDGGDHDLRPLKTSARVQDDLIAEAATMATDFMASVTHRVSAGA